VLFARTLSRNPHDIAINQTGRAIPFTCGRPPSG
jgi:hypothetical protein